MLWGTPGTEPGYVGHAQEDRHPPGTTRVCMCLTRWILRWCLKGGAFVAGLARDGQHDSSDLAMKRRGATTTIVLAAVASCKGMHAWKYTPVPNLVVLVMPENVVCSVRFSGLDRVCIPLRCVTTTGDVRLVYCCSERERAPNDPHVCEIGSGRGENAPDLYIFVFCFRFCFCFCFCSRRASISTGLLGFYETLAVVVAVTEPCVPVLV